MSKKTLHSNLDILEFDNFFWSINGKRVSKGMEEFLDSVYGEYESDTEFRLFACPYCKMNLSKTIFQDIPDEEDDNGYRLNREFQISICENCKYWEVQRLEYSNKCMDSPLNRIGSSVALKFENQLPTGCAEELAQFIRRNPDFLNRINPKLFEKFVADVFRANHKEAEVVHVGKPCDKGIDVIYIDDNSTEWLIQVKRREHSNRAEGFSTLQSILGTLALEGKRHGIIVTTADYFSYHAKKATKQAEKQGYTVELIDKGKLNRMISPLLPQTPWSSLFEHPLFNDVDDDIREYFYQQINFRRYNPNQPALFDL
jgi:HJR/Mrr/RecB family endonuclease